MLTSQHLHPTQLNSTHPNLTQPNPTHTRAACRIFLPDTQTLPLLQVDYSQVDAERNPLASVARLLGIGSAFGVPLSLGTDECGVLMLYSMSCLAPRSAVSYQLL